MTSINPNTPPVTALKIGGDFDIASIIKTGGDPFPLFQNFLDGATSLAGSGSDTTKTDAGNSAASGGGGTGAAQGSASTSGSGAASAASSQPAPQRIHTGKDPFYVDLGVTGFTMQAQKKPGIAPAVTWGTDWSPVKTASGVTCMTHPSGARATVVNEVRLVVGSPSSVSIVSTPFGNGKRFPDGSVLIPGMGTRHEAYQITPEGKLQPMAYGTHTLGGVRVDIVNVAVVRVKDANGTMRKYDSRGMLRYPGSAAGAGAHNIGVVGGGPMNQKAAQIKSTVEQISTIARSILEQIEAAGGADPKTAASIRALLAGLPAALDGALAGITHGSDSSMGGGGTARTDTTRKTSLMDMFRASNLHRPRGPHPGESVGEYIVAITRDYEAATTPPPASGSVSPTTTPGTGVSNPSSGSETPPAQPPNTRPPA